MNTTRLIAALILAWPALAAAQEARVAPSHQQGIGTFLPSTPRENTPQQFNVAYDAAARKVYVVYFRPSPPTGGTSSVLCRVIDARTGVADASPVSLAEITGTLAFAPVLACGANRLLLAYRVANSGTVVLKTFDAALQPQGSGSVTGDATRPEFDVTFNGTAFAAAWATGSSGATNSGISFQAVSLAALPTGTAISILRSAGAMNVSRPVLSYLPDAAGGGNYLVVFSEQVNATSHTLRTNLVGAGGALGFKANVFTRNEAITARIAVDPVDREWMVMAAFNSNQIRMQRIAANGTMISTSGTIGAEGGPRLLGGDLAWNPVSNRYVAWWSMMNADGSFLAQSRVVAGGHDDPVTTSGFLSVAGAWMPRVVSLAATSEFFLADGSINPATGAPVINGLFWDSVHMPSTNTLLQYDSVHDQPVPQGGTIRTPTALLVGTVAGLENPARFQVEVRPVDEPFTGQVMAETDLVEVGTTVRIDIAVPVDVARGYHWQARAVDFEGRSFGFSQFGDNGPNEADFRSAVNGIPAGIAARQIAETTSVDIPAGGAVNELRVRFEVTVDDPDGDASVLLVEFRPSAEPLRGEVTDIGTPAASGGVSSVTIPVTAGTYHWQYLLEDEIGGRSAWTPFVPGAGSSVAFSIGEFGSMGSRFCAGSAAGAAPVLLAVLGLLGLLARR